mgnify:CR=1 FL=1|jgi:hypothetical protein
MSALLRRCGEALYGPRWQTDLSRDLGVSDRTMRRWVAGVDDIPGGVYADLSRLMLERAQTLDELAEECKQAMSS